MNHIKISMVAGIVAASCGFWYLNTTSDPDTSANSRMPAHGLPPAEPSEPTAAVPESVTTVAAAATEELAPERVDYDGPLAELVPTPEQSRQLYEAEERTLATCMNERGFEYDANTFEDDAEREPWAEALEPGDAEAAGSLGYGLARSLVTDQVPLTGDANDERLAAMNAEQQQAWATAFSGPPASPEQLPQDGAWVSVEVPGMGHVTWNTESCLATARRAVHGDDLRQMQDEMEQERLHGLIASQLEKDAELIQAGDHWRDCMAKRGFAFRSSDQVKETLWNEFNSGKLDTAALEQREIELASADAHCFTLAGLKQAQAAAQQRAEAQVRAEHAATIEQLKTRMDEALTRARQLLDTSKHTAAGD